MSGRSIGAACTGILMTLVVAVGARAVDGAAAQGAVDGAAAQGAAVFAQNCAICHQSDAKGLAGQYPRLAGRIAVISGKPRGRAYLIDVVTYGMVGQVTVDKQSIVGVMPSLQLSDEDAARVLSYVESLGDARPAPFTPQEVAAERAKPHKNGSDVNEERRSLQSAKIIE